MTFNRPRKCCFVSGHDFSRAVNDGNTLGCLAAVSISPEVLLSASCLSQQHLEQNKERKVKVKRAEIRRMNVRLSVGRVWSIEKGMRTAGWCMVFLGMVAGFTGSAAAAENTAATRTALAVATNNAGPRTRVTLTAHVSADATGAPSGAVNFRSGETDLGSAFLDSQGNAALETDNL